MSRFSMSRSRSSKAERSLPTRQRSCSSSRIAEESEPRYSSIARGRSISVCTVGRTALPLMGTGDWNDGMNRVGEGGKGESVWLGWFLLATHRQVRAAGRAASATRARARRVAQARRALRAAIEREAWDGDWYRRAYFDDGTPLGSARERRVPDRFHRAVLGGDFRRRGPRGAARAMACRQAQLVRRDDGLVLLFTPPFDKTPHDPGYIKGYPPGLRENGGQYTHAAMWAILALAKLGDGARRSELFSTAQPDQSCAHGRGCRRYMVEPYVVAADVYSVAAPRRARRMDLVHRLGSVGCTAPGPRAFSAFAARELFWSSTPAFQLLARV